MTANNLSRRLQLINDRARMLNAPTDSSIGSNVNSDRSKNTAINDSNRLLSRGGGATVRTTVNGVFDMGTGTLTMTKYVDGQAVKSVTIEPGGRGSQNLGAFSGKGKYINESEYSNVRDTGPMPLGTYNIHNNSNLKRREGGPKDDYRQRYGVGGGWYRLELQDSNPNDDKATVRGTRGIIITERTNVREHIGFGSAGCLTIHPENKLKWLEIENMLGLKESTNKVLGTVKVIDSRPGVGNGSLDSAKKDTDVLNASNQVKRPTSERTL